MRGFAAPAAGMLLAASFSLLVITTGCRRHLAPEATSATTEAATVAASGARSRAVIEPDIGFWDVSALGWAADGARLAVAEGTVVHVLEATAYREILRIQTRTARIAAVAFSPDGKFLATSGTGRVAAVVWDLATGVERASMLSGRDEVPGDEGRGMETLRFSPDGKLLAGRAWDAPRVNVWTMEGAPGVAARGPAPATIAETMPTRTLDLIWRDRSLYGPRAVAGDSVVHAQMLAFTADRTGANGGNQLIGVADEGLATWDLTNGTATDITRMLQVPRRSQGHGGGHGADGDPLYALALPPEGNVVAAGTESGTVMLWIIPGGKVRHWLPTSIATPLLAFSRDGRRLAVVSGMDGSARTFMNAAPGGGWTSGASFAALAARADAVALDPEGERIAVAAAGALIIREVGSGRVTQATHPPLPLTALAVDPEARRLALGTATGDIAVLTVNTGALSWLDGGTGAVIKALAFSEDGRWLVSGAAAGATRIWDVDLLQSVQVLPQQKAVNAVAISPDRQAVVTAGEDGVVRRWETASGKLMADLPGNGCPVQTVRFSPRGPVLAANTTDGTLLTWDTRTWAPRFTSHERPLCSGERSGWPNTLAFTNDGRFIGYAGTEERLKWWTVDTAQGTTIGTSADGLPARAVAVSPRDPLLVAATTNALRTWSPPDPHGRVVLTGAGARAVTAAAFADGRFLFALDGRGLLTIWQVNPPSAPAPLTARLSVALFDHDSGYVKSASDLSLVEWLGSHSPPARCRLGAQFQSADQCAGGATTRGLLRATLSR